MFNIARSVFLNFRFSKIKFLLYQGSTKFYDSVYYKLGLVQYKGNYFLTFARFMFIIHAITYAKLKFFLIDHNQNRKNLCTPNELSL